MNKPNRTQSRQITKMENDLWKAVYKKNKRRIFVLYLEREFLRLYKRCTIELRFCFFYRPFVTFSFIKECYYNNSNNFNIDLKLGICDVKNNDLR